MQRDVLLTPEGLDKLKDEIEHLSTVKRREVAERIKEAREFGDISENSEYDDAKNEQAMLESRIAQLQEKLRMASVIETKDLSLFRSVKPNLSADEQRRIELGFRAVESQQVSMSVVSIEQKGSDALVRVRRRDTIQAGGRQQTSESQQTMSMTRTASGWVIKEIGR